MSARKRVSLRERFDAKWVPEPNTGCWLWTGCVGNGGYGELNPGGRRTKTYAHRVAYELYVGPIPVGLDLDHLCRVRSCVNPEHLEPVTRTENLRRGIGPMHTRIVTHCPSGHPYDEANTYVCRKNRRNCRACRNARKATPERRARRRAQYAEHQAARGDVRAYIKRATPAGGGGA